MIPRTIELHDSVEDGLTAPLLGADGKKLDTGGCQRFRTRASSIRRDEASIHVRTRSNTDKYSGGDGGNGEVQYFFPLKEVALA